MIIALPIKKIEIKYPIMNDRAKEKTEYIYKSKFI